MYKLIFVLVLLFFSYIELQIVHASDESKECVIILHGMGRTYSSMNKISTVLKDEGYTVWNETYPSTKQAIEDLSINHINHGLDYCKGKSASKTHFVTHSLGGILVRYYFQDNTISNLGSIVMLSPPNKGSEVADYLKDTKLYQWVTGPAGQQLGTNSDSLPNRLEAIDATIGVITGENTSDPWFSTLIPGKDDGKVSVERAKLDEMSDFLVVESGHTFIMRNRLVINQIKYFLKNGKFNK